jgi:hypothetical protein
MPDINLSPLTAEQSAIDRRRKMAEAMQQQAILPIDMPNVAGAKVSPYQGLAKLLQGYIAGKGLERADTQQKELEANTMSDFAKVFDVVGRTETIPGKVITPAVPSVAIPENVARQAELAKLDQPALGFEGQAAIAKNLMRPEDVQQIQNLPTSTVAVPAVMSPDQQVSALKASMLGEKDFTKTSAGKMMLAQALMQQRAQEQAAALRKQEAEQAIVKFGPEDTAGRIVNGVFKPIVQGVKQPKWEKSSQFDADGKETMGWVNTNAPNIPASFVKGTEKPAMTAAQQLDADAKIFAAEVEAQKAIDQGRVPLTFKPTIRGVKPLPPQGTKLETGVVYDTPRGRARWDGSKFTSVD